MVPNLATGVVLAQISNLDWGRAVIMAMKKMVGVRTEYISVDITRMFDSSRVWGNFYVIPIFRCRPIARVHLGDDLAAQEVSLPGFVIIYNTDVGLYIRLHLPSGMVLGNKLGCAMEYAAGTGQGISGEEV